MSRLVVLPDEWPYEECEKVVAEWEKQFNEKFKLVVLFDEVIKDKATPVPEQEPKPTQSPIDNNPITPPFPFPFGAFVTEEGTDMTMKVTGFMYRANDEVQVECSYWSNGDHKTVWLPIWRLTLIKP